MYNQWKQQILTIMILELNIFFSILAWKRLEQFVNYKKKD